MPTPGSPRYQIRLYERRYKKGSTSTRVDSSKDIRQYGREGGGVPVRREVPTVQGAFAGSVYAHQAREGHAAPDEPQQNKGGVEQDRCAYLPRR